jgi:thiol:disulfide interchange protein DsbD
MPCVLPIVSLKLFGLIKISQKGPREIWQHNIMYSMGVLSSFAALAVIISILQAAGQELGWGLHLQSPSFVLFMTLLCFLFALNLFGIYEWRLPNWLGRQSHEEDPYALHGAFSNGVLSTLLSTPCTAPFLGQALAFAFVSPFPVILCLFLGIGFGLSAPFLILGFFPQWLSYLPRPGHWMDYLKKIMGLLLLITVCWLFDILTKLTSSDDLTLIHLVAFVFVFFTVYIWSWRVQLLKYIFLGISLLFFSWIFFYYHARQSSITAVSPGTGSVSKDHHWQTWSEETLNLYRQQRKKVFMDFTAAWCLTCKVNEKLVLSRLDFLELAKKHQVELLLGDWTNKNEQITKWLKQHGVVGVPAYFYQNEEGRVTFLGELLTLDKIKKQFEE